MQANVLDKYKSLRHEERRAVDRELLAQKYKDDLLATTRVLCGFKDATERTHGPIIRALESASKRKLIVCPRGAFKSSISVVAYTVWRLIRDPNERILIDSEVFTNSRNFIRQIKAILENYRFVSIFRDWRGPDWTATTITVATRTIEHKESSITAGGVGTIKTGQHYSVIIADDLNSQQNSGSPENAQKVLEHYRYYTSLLEPNGTIVVVGTRYSQLDVIQNILDTEVNGS